MRWWTDWLVSWLAGRSIRAGDALGLGLTNDPLHVVKETDAILSYVRCHVSILYMKIIISNTETHTHTRARARPRQPTNLHTHG